MSLVSRSLAALFSSASQSQAARPFSLMIFNQQIFLYSNFPLLIRLLTAGRAKAARWACWLGSLGCLESHCMPVGVLTCTSSQDQLSKNPLCRCPRCCRAFQMALGVQLWPLSQAWRKGLICPSALHTAVQSEWLTCVYADTSTSPGCLG